MIAALIIMAVTVLFLVISLIVNMNKEYKDNYRKKLAGYEFLDIVFNDLKKSKDCYITSMKIEDDILYLEYWYYGNDDKEQRLEKVKKIIKEDCDFYGPIIGVNIKDVDVNINKVNFVN
jgi:uncharacterized protein YbcI